MRFDFSKFLNKPKTIVIKVGSARVSGDKVSVQDFLFDLTSAIRNLRQINISVILVSSGAIAQGKTIQSVASEPSLSEKQALAALGQNRLMNLYEGYFSRANLKIGQILFGKNDIMNEMGRANLKNTFAKLLDWQIIPIVNENDSVSTEELNLGDNDLLSALVSGLVGADMLLILTSVPGFMINETKLDWAKAIDNAMKQKALGPSGPGTGGMATKLRAAEFLLEHGIPTFILPGNENQSIERLFNGENLGTLFWNPNFAKTNPTIEELGNFFFPSKE